MDARMQDFLDDVQENGLEYALVYNDYWRELEKVDPGLYAEANFFTLIHELILKRITVIEDSST